MEYTQTIGSAELNGILSLPPSLLNKRVRVTVQPVEDDEKPNYRCKMDFVKGPSLPDSFFDPLPEEELELWGL